MPLVKVKTKYQVTLPTSVRKQVGLAVGDLLDATVQGNQIMLTPKHAIDRDLAIALTDLQEGRSIGTFRNAKEAVKALRRATK